jgi:hypothetical protein
MAQNSAMAASSSCRMDMHMYCRQICRSSSRRIASNGGVGQSTSSRLWPTGKFTGPRGPSSHHNTASYARAAKSGVLKVPSQSRSLPQVISAAWWP